MLRVWIIIIKNRNRIDLGRAVSFYRAASALQHEITRADRVEDSHFPDVLGMNSTVSFLDRDNGQQTKVTLVLPWQANMTKKEISVLSPLSCALTGLKWVAGFIGHCLMAGPGAWR
jgi:regulator of nucleoside diphosphate kinase